LVAALEGRNEISVGNIVGSNIFNLGFALGGAAMLGSLQTSRKWVWRDNLSLVGASFLFFALVGFDRNEAISCPRIKGPAKGI
jgi:cation:H+ antiporter